MMSSLEFLNFEMNELEGPIPPSMGNLENLKVSLLMLVYYTLVSSEFQLATYLHSASQSITMSKNFFDAVLPSELGKLMNLSKLIATDNLLSGKSLTVEMVFKFVHFIANLRRGYCRNRSNSERDNWSQELVSSEFGQ